jgi:hypothetical protein
VGALDSLSLSIYNRCAVVLEEECSSGFVACPCLLPGRVGRIARMSKVASGRFSSLFLKVGEVAEWPNAAVC